MTKSAKTITIHVDAKPFAVQTAYLSGAQIKALVQKDLQYQLFVEHGQKKSDAVVGDAESVKLADGMRFYTVPPAAFGE